MLSIQIKESKFRAIANSAESILVLCANCLSAGMEPPLTVVMEWALRGFLLGSSNVTPSESVSHSQDTLANGEFPLLRESEATPTLTFIKHSLKCYTTTLAFSVTTIQSGGKQFVCGNLLSKFGEDDAAIAAIRGGEEVSLIIF